MSQDDINTAMGAPDQDQSPPSVPPPRRHTGCLLALAVAALCLGGALFAARSLLPPLFKVISIYQKANDGDAEAQTAVAAMYFRGWNGKPDYAQATEWYRKAARQGFAPAQGMLGVIYENGAGGTPDYPAALDWFRKSAAQGNPVGENGVGWMYYKGQGVATDYAEALKWTKLAADQGLGPAMDGMGEMYRDGNGVPQDNVQAYMWYDLAEEASKVFGDHSYARHRDEVGAKMTPEQIAEAKKRAADWKPATPAPAKP